MTVVALPHSCGGYHQIVFYWVVVAVVVLAPIGYLWSAIGARRNFDEMIEPVSAFAGSFQVWDDAGTILEGTFNVAENVVNFTPATPLEADTAYNVRIPANGLVDYNGNPVAEDFVFRFSTGAWL